MSIYYDGQNLYSYLGIKTNKYTPSKQLRHEKVYFCRN